MSQNWQQIEEKARAAFIGVALGDALGATTEFMTGREIKAQFGVHCRIVGGGWLRLKPGSVTDDTEMSLHLARAILGHPSWNLRAIAEAFAQWMKSRPVDIGATCARGIRAYIQNGALEVPPNDWSAGNGAVMRMVAVALCTLGDEQRLGRYAVQQAHLTHNHPLSDAACVAVGGMVQNAVLGAPLARLRSLADELVRRHPQFGFAPYGGNSSAYVVDTLQTVLHYLFGTSSFEACLTGVVNQGGDADTTGAIAGMIAGALYGPAGLPRHWLKRLDPRVAAEAGELAVQLVRGSPLASIRTR